MILVIPDHINAVDLAESLREGGFMIVAKPGQIFELAEDPRGKRETPEETKT